ncbi:hypothetical protein ANCCAN_10542 [Ancylostoma caninum]|uniref:Uncharacterized protein n=1 Tax=Ancylostoma caninum TaxID=29170 RepID=A0A368GKA8_ANCCA|nr:hypothetical protein ANCCAN_10542 [Ancylostoma caninum]
MIRPKLYRALQKALRDVRAYQYEEDATAKVFRWIPNDRKAKKLCGGQRRRRERGGIHRCRRGRLLKPMTNQDSFFLRLKIRNY